MANKGSTGTEEEVGFIAHSYTPLHTLTHIHYMMCIDIQPMLSYPSNLRLHCLVDYISLIVTPPVCQGYSSHIPLTFKEGVYCKLPHSFKKKT